MAFLQRALGLASAQGALACGGISGVEMCMHWEEAWAAELQNEHPLKALPLFIFAQSSNPAVSDEARVGCHRGWHFGDMHADSDGG